jgi:hypothetical protein
MGRRILLKSETGLRLISLKYKKNKGSYSDESDCFYSNSEIIADLSNRQLLNNFLLSRLVNHLILWQLFHSLTD